LPEGRRRAGLAAAAEAMFADDFAGRALFFDRAAAIHYAQIVAACCREGRPIEAFAAMARVAGAGL
jgi:toxin FitB